MAKPTELKLGRFHYKLDPSGFWCAQFQTDPMSATITENELIHMAKDHIVYTKSLIEKVGAQTEQLIKDVAALEASDGQG